MANPPDIKAKYDELTPARSRFIDYAEKVASLTLPFLEPRGVRLTSKVYSQLGAQCARSLASTSTGVTFPSQVKWMALLPDPLIQQDAERKRANSGKPQPTSDDKLTDGFMAAEEQVVTFLTTLGYREIFSSAVLRNVHEGQTAVCVTEDAIRIFPLRNFVVFRDGSQVRLLITREEDVGNPYEEVQPITGDHEKKYLYTLVDYDAGDVWQWSERTPKKKAEKVKSSPKQWFVFVCTVPDVDPYCTGYMYDHHGIIFEVNHLSASLGEAAALAAFNVPCCREGGTITPEALEGRKSGQALPGNAEDVGWITSGVKLSEWQFVHQYRTTLREEMASVFALGIKDRVSQAATATEILAITKELDSQTQDLLSAYEGTLQRPLVGAVLHILGLDQIKIAGTNRDAIKVAITTGQSALQREAATQRMIMAAAAVKKDLDPGMSVDGPKLLDHLSKAQMFQLPDGVFGRAPAPAPDAGGMGDTATAVLPKMPNLPSNATVPQQ